MAFSSWIRNWKRSIERRWALYQTIRRKSAARRLASRPRLEALEDRWLLSTYTVTSTGDSGAGTLRDAITQANASGSTITEIDFNITGPGLQTINLASALPALNAPNAVYINGLTQGGAGNTVPLVELNGSGAGTGSNGLLLSGAGNTVSGLIIENFSSNGIEVSGANNVIGGTTAGAGNILSSNSNDGLLIDSTASGVLVQGNLIGTNTAGNGALGNGFYGVDVVGSKNTIGGTSSAARNVISGNFNSVYIDPAASGVVVQGNYIGINAAGNNTISVMNIGVDVEGAGNTVGGSVAGAGNVIAGSNEAVQIGSGASGVAVQGNYIGTDATGSSPLGNFTGVYISGSNNTVGGTVTAARNVISDNQIGVQIFGSGVVVQGNYIGINAAGTALVGSQNDGVDVEGSSNTVGGSVAGAGNVISGNLQAGVLIGSGASSVAVRGNYIGTDATGAKAIANSVGISVVGASNIIGGTATGAGNVISGNTAAGLQLSASGTTVQGNYIGTDLTGATALANSIGLLVSTSKNTIGGTVAGATNVISGNSNDGVQIASGVSGVQLLGNYIGTDLTGSKAVANHIGIEVAGNTNTIGGTATAARNIISGNSSDGVLIDSGVSGVSVQGNYIGTNVTGASAVANGSYGIDVEGSKNTVGGTATGAGNVISGNTSDGVHIGSNAPSVVVQGNYIGTDAAGAKAIANSIGVDVLDATDTVGGTAAGARNIISGNTSAGVYMASSGSTVQGNYIGTDVTGATAVANSIGVWVVGAKNTIGSGNVISGNSKDGVLLDSKASGVVVQGSYIGTTAAGNAALANSVGIEDSGNSNTIGGTTSSARNVISGNTTDGMLINSSASGVRVQGNYIGTDSTGASAMANGTYGVDVEGASNTVGGSVAGAGNVISGNTSDGVFIGSKASGVAVQGNYIGTNAAGVNPLGNSGNGVNITGNNNTVGAGNIISANSKNGVLVSVGAGNTITQNSIFANTGLGISLASGTNNSIVAPTIGTASITGYTLTVTGTYTAATANVPYVLEFFASPNSDAEGKVYVGSLTVTPTSTGTQNFTATLTTAAPRFYPLITATLTDNTGDTSQFSNGVSSTTIYTVTSAADSGLGTLRDAITQANLGSYTTIDFAIGTSGSTQTISLASALPALTANNVFINGLSQGGYGNITQLITLDGTSAGSSSDGVLLQASSDVVSGLVIQHFNNGIEVAASNNIIGGYASGQGNVISGNTNDGVKIDAVSGVLVEGNFIGTDATGATALANHVGVEVAGGTNTIGGTTSGTRNIISGNSTDGVIINSGATGVSVQGNYIGTDVTGASAVANGTYGVDVEGSKNTIGGSVAGAGNVISGNTGDGVHIGSVAPGVVVQGNYIGTDATGAKAIANSVGVDVLDAGDLIGGTVAAARNVISGNTGAGVYLAVSGSTVQGNYIGTDATGATAVANSIGVWVVGANNSIGTGNVISGNTTYGVDIDTTASGVTVQGNYIGTNAAGSAPVANSIGIVVNASNDAIGGTATGVGNVISGNTNQGLLLNTSGNMVQGNYIGINAAGNAALANSIGIEVAGNSNTIGGTASGARNVVSGNTTGGVLVDSAASGNQVQGNFIGTDATGTKAVTTSSSTPIFNFSGGFASAGSLLTLNGSAKINGSNLEVTDGGGSEAGSGFSTNQVDITHFNTQFSFQLTAGSSTADGFTFCIQTAGNTALGGTGGDLGYAGIGTSVAIKFDLYNNNGEGTDSTGLYTDGAVPQNVGSIDMTGSGIDLHSGDVMNVTLAYDGTTLTETITDPTANATFTHAYTINIASTVGGNTAFVGFTGGTGGLTVVTNIQTWTYTSIIPAIDNGVGISVSGSNNTIGGTAAGAGNVISGNTNQGVQLSASGVTVQGNYIGTDLTGTTALGNSIGLLVSTSNNTIGGSVAGAANIISGNSADGVQIASGVSGVQLLGNYIGTDLTGSKAVGNGIGVEVADSNNTIGSSAGAVAAHNVISGNTGDGVKIDSGVSGVLVQGNWIGTAYLGTAALGNKNGVEVAGNNNTIGTLYSVAPNQISGNSNDGVLLDSGSSGNQVLGNYIGTNAAGSAALANKVGVEDGGSSNTIGGSVLGARNVISGNTGDGVLLDSTATAESIWGNYIGLTVGGNTALANSGNGVEVQGALNTIGGNSGTNYYLRNFISGNGKDGVLIASGSGNQILGNFIGVGVNGTTGVGNVTNAIEIASSSNTVGGTVSGYRNVIAGSGNDGVLIGSKGANNLIQGNFIGTDANGSNAVANSGSGIELQGTGNTLGGTASGARNIIAGSGKDGVLIGSSASGTLVQGNYIGINNSGAALANGGNGLNIAGNKNTVGGTVTAARNIISGNSNDGVLIASGASGNQVLGNYIGTNAAGTAALANSIGVEVAGNSNTIGGASSSRNLISGNANDGVKIDSGASGNVVLGNAIGVNTYDSATLGNSGNGVEVAGNSNTIGASYAVAPNEISGNTGAGVLLASGSSGNQVLGNYIGTNHAGTAAVANKVGIEDAGSGNIIGGSVLGARNVISGNTGDGVLLDSTATAENMWGNYIGLNVVGNTALANGTNGVEVQGTGNTIGGNSGTNYYLRNFISGNKGDGVLFDSGASGNQVLGNFIGVGLNGTNGVANVNGIELAASSNTIGGTVAGNRNVLSGNSNDGVLIDSTGASNLLQGNFVGTDYSGRTALANSVNGIEIQGTGNTVGGSSGARNLISGNAKDGVKIDSGGSGNVVLGNAIGVNTYDSAALGNSGNGVEVAGNSNTIGASYAVAPNEISGNTGAGVLLASGSSGNQVLGNYIGTNHAGTAAVANKVGIEDAGSSNTIGGSVLGARNVISGNTGDGVLLDSTATAENMWGNYIGLNVVGNTALANGTNGVEVQGTGNTIGGDNGTSYFTRNFISGNKGDGVLFDSGASGNQVQGNFIGVGVNGTTGVGNIANAIEIAGSSNTIGGTTSGFRNVLSGSGNDGVLIDSTGANNLLEGNFVGTDYTGTNAVANSGNGIEIAGNNNTLGGTVSGAGNTISGNSKNGVLLSAGSGNSIRRNSIFANGGLGISLASGANNNIAAPTLSTATLSSGTLTVTGSFTAPTANVSYVLEFFANLSTDAEGKVYLGTLTVTPTSTGTQNFTFTTTNTSQLGTYPLITATLTDNLGDTSQFSSGVTSSAPPT